MWSTSVGNISPSLKFALCDTANSSLPAARWPSIHFQRSTGSDESSGVKGAFGTFLVSRKKMLRWRFLESGVDVHSYAAKVVNFPGS